MKHLLTFLLSIVLLGANAHSLELTCEEGNPANPSKPEVRKYSIVVEVNEESQNPQFKFGTAKIVRTTINENSTPPKVTSTLIEKIPCAFSTQSLSFSCSLVEELPRGPFTTARLHVKTHNWSFVRWLEGSGPQRNEPKLINIEEIHFFIENQRYRNQRGERQPIMLNKRFVKNRCQVKN